MNFFLPTLLLGALFGASLSQAIGHSAALYWQHRAKIAEDILMGRAVLNKPRRERNGRYAPKRAQTMTVRDRTAQLRSEVLK